MSNPTTICSGWTGGHAAFFPGAGSRMGSPNRRRGASRSSDGARWHGIDNASAFWPPADPAALSRANRCRRRPDERPALAAPGPKIGRNRAPHVGCAHCPRRLSNTYARETAGFRRPRAAGASMVVGSCSAFLLLFSFLLFSSLAMGACSPPVALSKRNHEALIRCGIAGHFATPNPGH